MSIGNWRTVLDQCVAQRGSAELEEMTGVSAPALSTEALERLVDACFWASLEQNEHRPCVFSLVTRGGDWAHLASIERDLVTPKLLRRLASASGTIDGPTVVVELCGDDWFCLGFALPNTVGDIKIDVLGPGVLRVGDAFTPLAVVEGPEAHFIGGLPLEGQAVLKLLGGQLGSGRDSLRSAFLTRLLRDLCRQRTGGTICLVAAEARESALRSLVEPLGRASATGSAKFLLDEALVGGGPRFFQPGVEGSTSLADARRAAFLDYASTLALLAAADGATVLEADSFDLVCFGARIVSRVPDLEYHKADFLDVLRWERQPAERAGGMRHRSALNLVAEHRSTVCFVASADGPLSVFYAEGDQVRCLARVDRLL